MNEELRQYFDTYLELFTTTGWKQLVDDWKSSIESVNDLSSCKDAEEMFKRQGQLDMLLMFASLEETIAQQIKAYEETSNPLED